MKKTLMVLSFALCATFAFAQTNRVVGAAKLDGNNQKARQSISTQTLNGAAVGYKGSIFAKDDTIQLFDFSMAASDANANYRFGTLTANDRVNGRAEAAHAHTYVGTQWHRWYGVDSIALIEEQHMEQTYPEVGKIYGGYVHGRDRNYSYSAGMRLDSNYCSSLNGWALLDIWGHDPEGSGAVNAYIAFDPVSTSNVALFSVRMFEYYYRYSDTTFVDYSVDNGTTWNSIAINTNVEVNGEHWGYARFTMPAAAAAGENVLLRIRFKSTYSRAHGYVWMLDDVAITKNVDNQFLVNDQAWVKGGYDQMPKGMSLPVEWKSEIINSGVNDQPNTKLKLDHIYAGNATNIHTWDLGLVPSTEDSTYNVTTNSSFPTSNLGDNYVTMTLTSDNIEARPYDTILYVVNDVAEDGSYTWAHDNGILNPKQAFLYGFDTATYESEDGPLHYIAENSPYYTNQGHSVYALYETGATVPTDDNQQPWVIRGIEYVVAVDEDVVDANAAQIAPSIYWDSLDGEYVYFRTVPTGVPSYTTVPADEYNDPTEMRDFGFYQTSDGYNTIRINLATQPELQPNKMYHVGYELLADARFAVAHSAYNTYAQWDEENQSYRYTPFYNNPNMKKYASNFTYGFERLGGYNHALIHNPIQGWSFGGNNVGYYPMIRLLVGPRSATKAINVTCEYEDDDEELGGVYSADLLGVCGSSVNVVEGANTRIYVIPESEVAVAALTVDGTEVEVTSLPSQTLDAGTHTLTAYYYEFTNVTEDHEVVASFSVGINDIAARVKMNLQPNPASSNVKLNIAGVAGYVNCDLLDMSGRVVRSGRINAETENTINLNGLAKGAYFVRITNNDFTKVERLIVR